MECFYCKGSLKKGKTSYVVNRKSYHLVLDSIPAYICKQCGEPLFTSEGAELIQEMIGELDRRTEALQATG